MRSYYFPRRYFMIFGTFLLAMIVLVDRACISVAKESIVKDLGLTNTQMGWVFSIFALSYALAQTPSGMLADRFGPRKILTVVVSLWSILTTLTGAAWNFISLLIVRFLFGAGEAGAFPGMAKAVFSWIPMSERGIANGINFSGGRIGVAVALPLVALLVDAVGWRMSFVVLGLIGFVWAFIWYFWFKDEPSDHKGISVEEKNFILTERQQISPEESRFLEIRTMFKSRNMWRIMIQYFCSNFTFFFTLTWLFPHIKERYMLDSVEAGFYASIPLLAGAMGNWVSGWLVDYIYKKKHWNLSRKIPAIIGFSLSALGLVLSIYMDNVLPAIIFLSIAIFGADMTLSPSWAVCVDIGKNNAGSVSGTMNMAGNLGSFITALAFPYINVWAGSVTPFFYTGAALNIIAIILWTFIRSDRAIEEY